MKTKLVSDTYEVTKCLNELQPPDGDVCQRLNCIIFVPDHESIRHLTQIMHWGKNYNVTLDSFEGFDGVAVDLHFKRENLNSLLATVRDASAYFVFLVK